MSEEMPPDPFNTAPEETIAIMKGLAQLHAAAMLAGLSERIATMFIADVFVAFSMLNAENADNLPESTVE